VELDLLTVLHEALNSLGLSLPEGADRALLSYLEIMLHANENMNLTAITDRTEAVHKHLVDSMSVLLLKDLSSQVNREPVWADVGSGAGFPGMVLAIAVPNSRLHLIESTGKKAHFLNTACAEMGLLKRVQVHYDRAEVLAQISSKRANVPRGTKLKLESGSEPSQQESVPRGTVSLRAGVESVFFRGVARLVSLAELGAPLMKVGGLLIAYKGPKAADELLEAAKAMKELKLELVERKDFTLPGVQEARTLLCLQKTAETPKRFPRLTGLAQKEPLL